MLQGYVDDSGSDGTRPPYVLAGFILSAKQWAEFSGAWQTQLDRAPKIEYFKMAESAERTGQFLGFQPEIRDRKIMDLLEVLETFEPAGIYSCLDWRVFRATIGTVLHGRVADPYYYLFPAIFDAIAEYQRRRGIFPEPTDVDFDVQSSAGQFALQTYPLMKNYTKQKSADMGKMLGRLPMMLDDEKVLPLQAADLFAWTMRRFRDKEHHDPRWDWLLVRIGRLVEWGIGYNEESFQLLLSEGRKMGAV